MDKEAFLARFAQNEPSNVPDFFRSDRKKVFYGQGWQARICFDLCSRLSVPVLAFISKGGDRNFFLPRETPHYSPEEFPFDKSEYDVLLALNEKHNPEVLDLLRNQGYEHLYYSDEWGRTNNIWRTIFFETFLWEQDMDPRAEVLEKGDFRILGTQGQPEFYVGMLRNEFFDIIAPSIFSCSDYPQEGSYE